MALKRVGSPTSTAPEPEKPQASDMTAVELATNIARAIGQGLTFGFADEAEAFARSTLGSETYEDALKSARQGLETLPASVRLPVEIGSSLVYGPLAAGRTAAATALRSAGMGALYGAGTGEGVTGRASGALFGGTLGGTLPTLTPKVTEGAKELLSRGVPVTIGQAFGPTAKRIEEAATSIPFAGDVIKGAQRKAIERFGTAAYNEALEPIGAKIPRGLTGRDAFEAAEQAISRAYDDVIKDIDLPAGQAFVQDVSGVVGRYANELPKKEADQLAKIVQRELTNRIVDGRLSKEAFKEAQSAIRGKAYQFGTSTDAYQKDLGDALNDVAGELFEVLQKEAPELATQLQKVDTAYSRFVPLQKAAAKGEEAVFTPAQLRQQIRAQGRRTPAAMARGELPMQRLAETGQNILGARLPDSGTATRGLISLGALGGGGAAVGLPLEAMALGAGMSSLYTTPAQAFLRRAIPLAGRGLRTPAAAGLLAQPLSDKLQAPLFGE